jgi:hypothetical protein
VKNENQDKHMCTRDGLRRNGRSNEQQYDKEKERRENHEFDDHFLDLAANQLTHRTDIKNMP